MDIRTAIWESRFDALRLRGYYGDKRDRYARHCRILSGLALLAGSASIAAWLQQWQPWVGPALAVVVAVIAAFFPVVKVHVWKLECEMAQDHWTHRDYAWDGLWLEDEVKPGAITLERIQSERAEDLRFRQPSCPMDAALNERANEAALRALGVERK